MSTKLVETVSSKMEPALLAGAESEQIKIGIMLAAGKGVIERGSVITPDESGEYWSVVSEAPAAESRLAILGITTDTGVGDDAEEQLAYAYLSGLFNREALVFGGDIEMTAAIEELLRGKGIYLDGVIPIDGALLGN